MNKAERDVMRAELIEEIKQHPMGVQGLRSATSIVARAREESLTDEQLAQDFALLLFSTFTASEMAVEFATSLGALVGGLRATADMAKATLAAADPAGRQN